MAQISVIDRPEAGKLSVTIYEDSREGNMLATNRFKQIVMGWGFSYGIAEAAANIGYAESDGREMYLVYDL